MYPDESSKSAALAKRAAEVLPGGNTRHSVLYPPYPIYASSGKGCRITDVDGSERIDCVNNMSSLIHGHGNAGVLQALADQAGKLLCAGAPTESEIELAAMIAERLPSVDQVRFANSGSEGVMFACRAARAITGRARIAKVEGAYHGSYDAVEFGLSPLPDAWGDPDRPAAVPATSGLAEGIERGTVVIPFNNVDATRAILEANADSLAAVIIDPLVSRMGFIPASPEYLDMIRTLTRELGILLIFDEVFSFRIDYNGAQGAFGVQPDLTSLGKVIGGGMPVGAVAGTREAMSVFDHGGGEAALEHAGTFNANPMTMAAGKAALEQLTPEALTRLNALGDRLRRGLNDILRETGVEGYVAGQGSLSAFFMAPGVQGQPQNYRELFMLMAGGALEKGMMLHRYLLNAGVQIIPPGGIILSTPMTEDDIDEILTAFRGGVEYVRDNVSGNESR